MATLSVRAVQMVFDRLATGAETLEGAVATVADLIEREEAAHPLVAVVPSPRIIDNHLAWCPTCKAVKGSDNDRVDAAEAHLGLLAADHRIQGWYFDPLIAHRRQTELRLLHGGAE